MDSRLIFLHYFGSVTSKGGTQEGRPTGDWKCPAAIRGDLIGKSVRSLT